jgi:hypothetical protein
VFFGDQSNMDTYNATIKALQEIIADESTAFKGMFLTDPKEPKIVNGYVVQHRNEIAIYADGQQTTVIGSPAEDVGEIIKSSLRKDYKEIIEPRRTTASLTGTTTVASVSYNSLD